MVAGEGPAGGGRWPDGTCFFSREKEEPEDRLSCAFPAPVIWGQAAIVWNFFKESFAAVKRDGMTGAPGHRNRNELESLARGHRVAWNERMLRLFRIVEEPWITAATKALKEAADAAKNQPAGGRTTYNHSRGRK